MGDSLSRSLRLRLGPNRTTREAGGAPDRHFDDALPRPPTGRRTRRLVRRRRRSARRS